MLAGAGQERGRVLVVDDEETIREMLAEFLELEGYQVVTAADLSLIHI